MASISPGQGETAAVVTKVAGQTMCFGLQNFLIETMNNVITAVVCTQSDPECIILSVVFKKIRPTPPHPPLAQWVNPIVQ